jgi:hypothetical protein
VDIDESCPGYFKKIYGLPCRHDIREYQLLNTWLPLELVQKQWILKWPQPNEFENPNNRHEQLQSPRSRILMTVTKVPATQQEVLASQLDSTVSQSLL